METFIDSKGKIFKAKVIRTETVDNINKNVYRTSAMSMLKDSKLPTNVKLVIRNLYSMIALTTRHKIICKRYDKRLTKISMLNFESNMDHIKARYWEAMNLTKDWLFSRDFAKLSEEEQLKQLGIRKEEFVKESYEKLLKDYWEARMTMVKDEIHEQTVHEFEEQLKSTNDRVSVMEHEIEVLAANQISLTSMVGKMFGKKIKFSK